MGVGHEGRRGRERGLARAAAAAAARSAAELGGGRLRVLEAGVGAHEQIGLVFVGGGGGLVVDHGGGRGRRRGYRTRLVQLGESVEVEFVGVAFAVHLDDENDKRL